MTDHEMFPETLVCQLDSTSGLDLQQLEAAVRLSPSPTVFLSPQDLRFQYVNYAAEQFFQVTTDELQSRQLNDFIPERDLLEIRSLMQGIRDGLLDRGTVTVSAGDGVGLSRMALQRIGNVVVAVAQDGHGGQRRSHSLGETDPLTGLLNRSVLRLRIQQAIDRDDQYWGVLFLDLNDYKQVNDLFGHVAGDRVLVEFARKLEASVRPGDLLARYGGDEFAVLVDRMLTRSDLRIMADRIAKEVRIDVTLSDQPFAVTASIGCALAASSLETVDDMISEADRDMYRVKRSRTQ